MDEYKRYALFVVPDGPFFAAGSAWLGWDSAAGAGVEPPSVAGLPDRVDVLTKAPRKYGFHGTIKPPFALAEGTTAKALHSAARAFCAARPRVVIPSLVVRRLGGFVAITPAAPSAALADLAGRCVAALDPFRASPSDAELARRRTAGLNARQDALLIRWGYPFVMEEFRFHMTLTGRTAEAETTCAALAAHFAPVLPEPFVIKNLAVMGECAKGRFHLLQRYELAG